MAILIFSKLLKVGANKLNINNFDKQPKAGDIVQQSASITDLKDSSIGDLTKRFVGSDPKNYICFGTTVKEQCTINNGNNNYMYRIIGITKDGELKLQKYSSLGTMKWHNDRTSNVYWDTINSSSLFTSLNSSGFLTNDTYTVNEQWRNLILNKTWTIGDVNYYSSTPNGSYGASIYEQEQKTNSGSYKIGLIYISDFYLAFNEGGTQDCYSYYAWCKNGWMFHGEDEWTMSRYGLDNQKNYRTGIVTNNGQVGSYYMDYSTYVVRPVFYLSSKTKIKKATGGSNDPYIVEL